MKNILLAGCVMLALCGQGYAEIFTYACRVRSEPNNDFHLYSAILNTSKNTITWRGTVYRNVKPIGQDNVNECAKECFGNGKVRLNTATQGVADLSVGKDTFDCDLVRK